MIKNFIFDFGGVLYKIDETRTLKAFAAVIDDPEVLKGFDLNTLAKNDLFRHYEKGSISSIEFRNSIRQQFKIHLSDEEIDEKWNATLLHPDPKALEVVRTISSIGRTALLSNTNEIHFNCFEPQCRELFALFDQCFYSYRLGIRKPEKEIFEHVLSTMKFNRKETIFIDDSPDNIEAAANLGIAVFHVRTDNTLTDLLEKLTPSDTKSGTAIKK